VVAPALRLGPPCLTFFSLHDALPISAWRRSDQQASYGRVRGAVQSRCARNIAAADQGAARKSARKPGGFCRCAEHQSVHGSKVRSEEHTSELQSRENLVCRLLLEKKK